MPLLCVIWIIEPATNLHRTLTIQKYHNDTITTHLHYQILYDTYYITQFPFKIGDDIKIVLILFLQIVTKYLTHNDVCTDLSSIQMHHWISTDESPFTYCICFEFPAIKFLTLIAWAFYTLFMKSLKPQYQPKQKVIMFILEPSKLLSWIFYKTLL